MASTKTNGKSWVYGLILIDKDDKSVKYCALCPPGTKPIKCGPKGRCNTTNLSSHLLTHHWDEAIKVKTKYSENQKTKVTKVENKTRFKQCTIEQTLCYHVVKIENKTSFKQVTIPQILAKKKLF